MMTIFTTAQLDHVGIALAFVVVVAVLIFVMVTDHNDDDPKGPPYA